MSKRLMGILAVGALVIGGVTAALVVSGDDEGDRKRTQTQDRQQQDRTGRDEVTCSAADQGTDLEQPADMPDPVFDTLLSVARAATACDYEELARLAGPDFEFAFGGVLGGDAATEEWRAAEARGEPVLRTLHDLLIGPYVFDGERFVWPTPETIDYRTGIGVDGQWQFLVAGD